MKNYMAGALLIILSVLSGCSNVTELEYLAPYGDSSYRLDSGDQVRVIVFGQADISNTYVVDASGKLSIPLVGSLRASGQTTQQIEASIHSMLQRKDLVKNPEVSVQIILYRSYFMLGEVGQSGQFSYIPGMTVQEAIATAGGYTIYADQGPVRVTRNVDGHKEVGYLSPLDPIAPGDTIHVEERLF